MKIDLPADQYFAPAMYPLPPRQLNWIGHLVKWVRDAENYSLIYYSSITALAIISSIAMLASVVGIPLFILCFKEFIRQEQRSIYDRQFQGLFKQSIENGRHHFKQGVRRCIPKNVQLSQSQREDILTDLKVPRDKWQDHTDQSLIHSIALKDKNFTEHYHILLIASDT